MRRTILGILIGLLIFSGLILTQISSLGFVKAEIVFVKCSVLNVRSGPGTEYEVVDRVNKGTHLVVQKETAEWIQVVLPNGKKGWVFSKLVRCRARTLRGQIEEILKAEGREAMFYAGEINIDSLMASITLEIRSSMVTKGLLREISYSLVPDLREVTHDRIIRLWFQRSLGGGQVALYGKATGDRYSKKIEFKFYK